MFRYWKTKTSIWNCIIAVPLRFYTFWNAMKLKICSLNHLLMLLTFSHTPVEQEMIFILSPIRISHSSKKEPMSPQCLQQMSGRQARANPTTLREIYITCQFGNSYFRICAHKALLAHALALCEMKDLRKTNSRGKLGQMVGRCGRMSPEACIILDKCSQKISTLW